MLAFVFKSSNFLSWLKHWYNLINNLALNNSTFHSFIKINLNFHVNKCQCKWQTFFFFSFFYICLNSFRIVSNSFILHSFSLNFYNIIESIFSQMQMLTFHFDFSKTNLTIALKIHFNFFLTSTCNFIVAKNKKKMIIKMFWMIVLIKKFLWLFENDHRQQSFAMIIFFLSRKICFICFLIIFKIDYDDKLKKRTTD